jgi:hypothetical protein
MICQHCGKSFEKGYIGGTTPKHCPACRPIVARERAKKYQRDIKSGERKRTRKLDIKLRGGTHYPWEKPTKCKCQICEMDGHDPYYTRIMDWTGRGIPRIRCDRHGQQVRVLDDLPTTHGGGI